jgi:DNA-binding NarL/FixJ family response regulator
MEGLRTILTDCTDLTWAGGADTLEAALDVARATSPDVLIVDKAFGMQDVLHCLAALRVNRQNTGLIVWGNSLAESEALRLLQAGARGMIRKAARCGQVLECIRSVAAGRTWLEDGVLRDGMPEERNGRTDLTPRERQVLELIEQGLKNREIARELGIQPGTVKIHLKHIFEKTGVRGRYGLAINGFKHRDQLETASVEALESSGPLPGSVQTVA